jgi:hypothetical protein
MYPLNPSFALYPLHPTIVETFVPVPNVKDGDAIVFEPLRKNCCVAPSDRQENVFVSYGKIVSGLATNALPWYVQMLLPVNPLALFNPRR